jgi:iron complex transport system ATP-binding protein
MRQWSDADERAVEEAMALTGTAEFAHLPVDSLSGGQRQRCWIAMALAQETPTILLDEPTTWLDLRYQVDILELLQTLTREHGRTVVTVLHDLNFAVNYADILVFLKKGRIAGVVDENASCTPELIKTVFDVEVQMSLNPQTGKPFFMPFRARQGKPNERLRVAAAPPSGATKTGDRAAGAAADCRFGGASGTGRALDCAGDGAPGAVAL